MDLSDHDLTQLDEEELLNFPGEVLRRLSVRLLNNSKEVPERLSQNSRNSSRPPGSDTLWEKERMERIRQMNARGQKARNPAMQRDPGHPRTRTGATKKPEKSLARKPANKPVRKYLEDNKPCRSPDRKSTIPIAVLAVVNG